MTPVPLIVANPPNAVALDSRSAYAEARDIYHWPPPASSAPLPLHHFVHQGSDGLDILAPSFLLPGRTPRSSGAECLLRLSLYVLPVALLPNKAVCSSATVPLVMLWPSSVSSEGSCDGVFWALALRCDEYHVADRGTFKERGDETFGLSVKGLSSISSPHISSASVGTIVPFFRKRRVERRSSLFLIVGVRDLERLLPLPLWCERRGMRVSMADSSSEDTGLVDDAARSVQSSTKPMPGARGVCATGWWAIGSLFRRQDRAKTPARRMMVPRAIS